MLCYLCHNNKKNNNCNYLLRPIMLMNTSLATLKAIAHRLQHRNACKIQNGRQGAPKWRTGSGKMSTPRFLGILSNFR